jgi:hypothetical protein
LCFVLYFRLLLTRFFPVSSSHHIPTCPGALLVTDLSPSSGMTVLCHSFGSVVVVVWLCRCVVSGVDLLGFGPSGAAVFCTFCVSFSWLSRPMVLFSSLPRLTDYNVPLSPFSLVACWSRVLLLWVRQSRVVQTLCCLILRLDLWVLVLSVDLSPC